VVGLHLAGCRPCRPRRCVWSVEPLDPGHSFVLFCWGARRRLRKTHATLQRTPGLLAVTTGRRVVLITPAMRSAGEKTGHPHPPSGQAAHAGWRGRNCSTRVMIEAVENHMPEVIVIDEIARSARPWRLAFTPILRRRREPYCRLVPYGPTAHATSWPSSDPLTDARCDLIGVFSRHPGRMRRRAGAAARRRCRASAAPTFPLTVEMRSRSRCRLSPAPRRTPFRKHLQSRSKRHR